MIECSDCGEGTEEVWKALIDNRPLCLGCSRREILGHLADCSQDDFKTLRRRTEDLLRKNPSELKETLISLIQREKITYFDVI